MFAPITQEPRAQTLNNSNPYAPARRSQPLAKEKSRLKLTVWVRDSKLAVKGIVVTRRPGFGISVKFTEMTEEAQEPLRRFVQSLLGLRGT